jgi:hypothetical protein
MHPQYWTLLLKIGKNRKMLYTMWQVLCSYEEPEAVAISRTREFVGHTGQARGSDAVISGTLHTCTHMVQYWNFKASNG